MNLTLVGGYDYKRAVFGNWFPKLNHYEDCSAYINAVSSMEGFILRHRNLKSIDLKCKESSDFGCLLPVLKVIALNCKELEKIAFGLGFFTDPVPCLTFLQNLFRLPNLKEIKMILLGAEHVSKELQHLPNKLEILDIEFCGGISELIPAVVQLRNLTFLRLYEIVDGEVKDISPSD